ncbi:hypothetical protein EOD39_11973 [Acipenser ruthenus]|uniref:Uncharacterized protein n=1 Tax=Acipenser ruthenus TaxID=7906 RepID=A0A662YT87_ACIRT|nr:hypothetical protein EOD39_11973 [Acipenser ruthenus]
MVLGALSTHSTSVRIALRCKRYSVRFARMSLGARGESDTLCMPCSVQRPSQEIPCAQAPRPKPRCRSSSPQARRVKRSRQARDIMDLKAQMTQVLELLSRQQAPVALVEVPALIPLAHAPVPGSPMEAQAELKPQPLMAEEDTLSIAASWGESSFPTEMEEGEELAPSTEAEPSSEFALEASLAPLSSSMLALTRRLGMSLH